MNDLSLTEARGGDIPVIAKILTDATNYKLSLGDESWGKDGWRDDEIQDRIDHGYIFYLASIKGEVVGTVAMSFEDARNWGEDADDAAYIHQLAITSEYHGKDLGAQIVVLLEAKAIDHGKKLLRLDCDSHNDGLCSYYQNLGFNRARTNTRPDNELGEYEAALFEKNIAGSGKP